MAESDLIHKDQYYVAVKIFLEKEGKFLIIKDTYGAWDLPGGRLRTHEFDASLESVIARKMTEEVGDFVQYELGNPVTMMRHQRVEQDPGADFSTPPTIRIFAVGYEATWKSGEPQCGQYIVETKWVDIQTFKPEKYFAGGWLRGVQDYLAHKKK